MIRIIREICVARAESNDDYWYALPIVPGSATLKEKITQESAGRLKTYTISATLHHDPKIISLPLRIMIVFDNNKELRLGTTDVPAYFEIERETSIVATCKYEAKDDI